jgi:RHS repeat-associated protein
MISDESKGSGHVDEYRHGLAKSGTCPPAAPNFVYDGENRMVSDPTAGATYVYDGNGNRVQKCLPTCTSPTSSIVYLFSGSQDIAEYDNGAAPSSPSSKFIYSDSGAGAGLLAAIAAGATTYYQSDHLGWRVSTNTSGQVVGQQGTFPFGESWYSSSGNEFVFTSYQRDAESGLDYAMARYYDSTVGRFCSADPVGGESDDPQTWNRYTYSRNDPIDVTDPSGKSWWSSLLIDVGVAAAMYFAPEIETFIGNELGIALGDSDQAILTAKSANYGGQFAGLLTRSAATTGMAAGADASAAGAFGGLGAGLTGAAAAQAAQSTDQSNPQQGRGPVAPVPNSANQKTDCEHKILNATNNQFGTNFNSNNVTGEFQYSTGAPAGQGTLNLNITGSQAANVSAGRYPLHWWSYVIGYGSTLHVPTGPGGADSPSTLKPTANQFTAHLDSAYPYGVGFVFHYFQDMKGVGGYKPCPR